MIQRYDIYAYANPDGPFGDCLIEESNEENGAWSKYKDVKKLKEQLETSVLLIEAQKEKIEKYQYAFNRIKTELNHSVRGYLETLDIPK